MKTISIILICLLFCSCETRHNRPHYKVPSAEDIDAIVRQVIYNDSLPVFKNSEKPEPIAYELRKLEIVNPKPQVIGDVEIPIPPDRGKILLRELITSEYSLHKTGKVFEEKDSAYLFFQNRAVKNHRIDHGLSKTLSLTTFEEQKDNRKKGNYESYYDITIPVFSQDNNTAYVQISHYRVGSGGAYSEIFKRKNGKWEFFDYGPLWDN